SHSARHIGGSLPSQCSSLVAGVLYGSFSLRELFPSRVPGCSWSLENPDPTKYSLYLRFTRHPSICQSHSPMLLPLDHHLANQSCPLDLQTSTQDVIDLCGSQLESEGPYSFLQFDKNFVELCLSRLPSPDEPPVTKETLELRLVEVLLINNENSSQFTCGVLCRWFEECLRNGRHGDSDAADGDGCRVTQTGCVCPNNNVVMAQPVPLLPSTPHNNGSLLPEDCCLLICICSVLSPYPDPYSDSDDDDLKVKTQRPRSADQPGVFQAQTGDPAAEEWSQWSVCSLTCGQGWQVRTRSCVSSPYGTLCSVHGLWEEWSSWSLCSVTCGRGSRTRTRNCVSGGEAKLCGGPEKQTKLCNIAVCPVEGQWLDWAPWSRCSVTCSTGSQQRQRRCSASVHVWAECKGPHQETRECTNPSCGGGGNWGSWNHWSLCSKTCDSGWQRRFRMCEGTGIQGYPCDGSGEEVRSCNDKKCPAPHEICRDEYLVAMTWKSASAGETVYNKCPTNATGSASRRCLLDANGVAYWGPPSFARCVSMEFRYLHLSLREHLAKGQRTLAGEGMSQVVRNLLDLLQRRSYYSGDLLFSTEILRNVTDTFKRATYIPVPDDAQKFFQVVSYMLDMENLEKWEDAHQVECLALSRDINFPMKGRRGMKDWARSAEDKLYIPKEVFTLTSDDSFHSLSFSAPAVINSKILTVTVRPEPKPSEPMVVVELASVCCNVMVCVCVSLTVCVRVSPISREAGAKNWDTEGCQTLTSAAVHTKCLCSRISTYAVLAQQFNFIASHVVSPLSSFLLSLLLFILSASFSLSLRYIRSERSIILVNFCLSILASNILILVGQSQTLSKGLCTVTAAFLHFFFLASFCWVLTEAWQSYLAVIGKMRTRLIRKRFLCLGWGLPALVVAVSVGFTRARGYGTPSYCWLSLEGGLLYAFVGPAAVIVLVNMLIGIVVFNKLMSRDGISDKSKKQRAGPPLEASRSRLLLKCSKCGVISSTAMSSSTASSAMASLWSSCVVLPLLALTWMSAVLAITDRRSTLFQVLFAVFDSVQGFVIITVHCVMRREVQDAVRCRMGGCKDDSENSPDSCKNGQVQIMEVNTCNPATITGTLSRISLDEEDDPKLATHQEGGLGVNFSSLPGNIPPPNLLIQVPPLGVLNELSDTPVKKEVNMEQKRHHGNPRNTVPVYLCTDSGLGWSRPPPPHNTQDGPSGGGEGDYMVLPRRTVSLKPPPPPGLGLGGEDKPLNVDDPPFPPPPSPMTLHPAESEAYPADFISPGDHNMNIAMNMNPLSIRVSLAIIFLFCSFFVVPSSPFQKVMHTRKRHSELYHELNHPTTKFHTIDRYNRDPAMSTFKVRAQPYGASGKRKLASPYLRPLQPPTPLPNPTHTHTLSSLPPLVVTCEIVSLISGSSIFTAMCECVCCHLVW
uniref:Adhesion G protein-coupled receptor B2 n=1 Tax=Oncorhynchus kisutch TaxID=8019 RepID=A0A8C7CVB0_ONCKI